MATNNELDIIARTRYEVCSLFFQEELWPWQLFIASIIAVITLIIPGHLFKHYVKNYGI